MKLKISPKDAVIFAVFSVFLLYFSAVAVQNILELVNVGEFSGLIPDKAFTTYLGVTLFVFFAVIAVIIASVSKTIFNFEQGKGFGINFGESEEKGYSRWLKEKEMKKAPNIYQVPVKGESAPYGGVVFINDGKNMWVDNSEYHTLVIGVTGGGKTTAVIDPLIYSLCQHEESMIVTDPKGEIYQKHSELLKARGYNCVVLNFRNPSQGNAWNPLTLPYRLYKQGNIDKAIELVDDVAHNIFIDKDSKDDPFWPNSSADYFAGCALALFEDAKEEEVNIKSINYMTTVGEDKFGAGSTYIKEYFNLKGESSQPYTFASNTINAPNETKGSILSVYRQKIRLFASRENLSEMLSYSDFDMADIGRKKTAVFMVIHDEKTTYHALATIFLKQCYETLIDVAQENGGPLPYRTNFLLDEFANMPPLKDVTTMVTAARSRKIRFTFIIQNFAQLNDVYGKDDAETIRSNCGNLIYLLTTELAALEEISKLCGEVKGKDSDKQATKPLISVSDLQKLKMNEVIIIRSRLNPFRVQLKPAYEIDWGDSEYDKNAAFPERELKTPQLFDLKEFVKVRKRSKMGDDLKGPKGMPGLDELGFGGFGGMGNREMPRIPTFEEFMAQRNANKKPSNPPRGLDVDELVKKIDAKIAELEKEEAKEKQQQVLNNEPKVGNANVGLSPFENKKVVSTPKFIEKDLFDEFEDEDKTEVLEVVNENQIKNFNDLMNKKSEDSKPSIMIGQPIKEAPKVDFPDEPIINKPLSGIEMVKLDDIESKPVEEKKVIETSKTEVVNTDTKPKVIQTTQKNVINTIPVNGIKVDTQSKIINDDNFFDDFFE